MSIVVRFRDGAMKISTAGLVVLSGLILVGCSRPLNMVEMATNFRDKVSSDAATAAAKKAMRPIPNEYGGDRPRPKAAPAPGPVGPDGKPEAPEGALIPGGPVNPGPANPSAAPPPPVVYYYPAPAR